MVTTVGMGLASSLVHVDVVDGFAGMDRIRSLGISGVPTVVLDDRLTLENPPANDHLLEFVLHAADRSRPRPRVASVPFRACGRLPD